MATEADLNNEEPNFLDPAVEDEQAISPSSAEEPSSEPVESADERSTRQHVEAGRKGARRIHELIERGRLYEEEHGLKAGRQRLRQLIQEGKIYEREHGLRPPSTRSRERRRPRLSREQTVHNLVIAILRIAKPAYRNSLQRLLQTWENELKK